MAATGGGGDAEAARLEAARAAAEAMVEWDPNEETREATRALLAAPERSAELLELFGSRLEFGTAGLRGPMGPGTSRMNDAVIIQSTQGLCRYLQATLGEAEVRERGVVIGFDHRATPSGALRSERFGDMAATVFLSQGIRVHFFRGITATPMVPWTVDQKHAAAGIMVTASHNPREDDGYKVYWGNGAQIIPPHDKGIATEIERAENLRPWDASLFASVTHAGVLANPLCTDVTDDVVPAYVRAVRERLCRHHAENGDSPVRIAYTAMHGVGYPFVQQVFEAFGHRAPVPVAAQVEADPSFPTVAFPNPEEGKGALKLAMETARANGCSLILANDPDADRLAVAEFDEASGEWRVFSGNEIGVLFAHWEWTKYREAHGGEAASGENVYMLTTAVTSRMIAAMAKKEGFQFDETLTGFKWLGNRTEELRRAGMTVLFSTEEAIGFCVGDIVKDKDGICAAAVFAEMAGALARAGRTVTQHMRFLYDTYGHFRTNNRYVFVDDPAKTAAIFSRLRNEGAYWFRLGRFPIRHIRDLTKPGLDTTRADGKPTLPTSSSHMLTFFFENGCTMTLRTSGTEPKLKYYVEHATSDPDVTKRELDEIIHEMMERMLQPGKYGLKMPKDE